jgi:rhodanese-related sulfurtransferase
MSTFSEVSAAEAIVEVKAGTILLDVREQDEWDRGHAPGATFLPMSLLPAGVDGLPEGQRLLVVCHAGSRSLRVTKALLDAGYDAVNVAGGMLDWADAGGEVVTDSGEAPTVD